MRICDDHWRELRSSLEARGLGHLVDGAGDASRRRTVADLEGHEGQFDPLAAANWLVCGRALRQAGLSALRGRLCPICEAVRQHAGVQEVDGGRQLSADDIAAKWIDPAVDVVAAHCRSLGLASPGA